MEKEKIDELLLIANNIIKEAKLEDFTAIDIREINFKPHVPVIGVKTIEYANKRSSIYITQEVPCDHPGCNLKLSEHKGDTVMVMKLESAIQSDTASTVLQSITNAIPKDIIDGFVMVQKDKSCVFI